MKITVPLLLCLTTAAAAGNFKPEPFPELVANDKACTKPSQRVPMLRTMLESDEIWVLHQCGPTNASTELWFKHDEGWEVYTSATIRDDGAIMSVGRLRIRLLYEETTFAALVDGAAALIHRVDTEEWGKTLSRIDVCSRVDKKSPNPRWRYPRFPCVHATVECPAGGCEEPTLENGVVSVMSAHGPVNVID